MRSVSVIWLTGLSFWLTGGCNLSQQPEEPPPPIQPQPQPQPQPPPELLPEETPSPPTTTTHHFLPGDSTFLWSYGCSWTDPPEEDPFPVPDCNYLLVENSGEYSIYFGMEEHHALLKVDVSGLPEAESVKKAQMELFCTSAVCSFGNCSLTLSQLNEEWWRPCSEYGAGRKVVCDNELPRRSRYSSFGSEEKYVNTWWEVDITDLYKKWRAGQSPNYGILLSSSSFTGEFLFYSSQYGGDPSLRPRLVIEAKNPEGSLKFPLEGFYSEDRINWRGEGGDFGDPWDNGDGIDNDYCADDHSIKLLHTGIDLRAGVGDSVFAVQDGIVKYARTDVQWGGYIVLEHRGMVTSTYTHAVPTINTSVEVTRGQLIGTVAAISGAHLHFQWRRVPYDPNNINLSLRGRLPEKACVVEGSTKVESAFPGHFKDPKTLNWE